MHDRRKEPRIKDKLVVVCRIPAGAKTEEYFENSHDISNNGIRISIPKKAVRGDVVTLKINLLNDAIPISAKGRVIWKIESSDTAGLEFSDLDDWEEGRVKSYIKRKLKDAK